MHGSLAFFIAGTGPGTVHVPTVRPRSVKDAIEASGIPHPEVDLVLVDGVSVGFDAVVHGGERLDVLPADSTRGAGAATTVGFGSPTAYGQVSQVRPPPPAPRFTCDVHLGRLARRLRLLGFDTWYRTDAGDDELAAVAVHEERILLTRDRGLLMRKVIRHGYCPRSDDPAEQVTEVLRRYDLADSIQPLSRCVRCNGVLAPVDKSEILDRLPPHTRSVHDEFSQCASCGQVYWPGSHLQHIFAFVDRARDTASADAWGSA